MFIVQKMYMIKDINKKTGHICAKTVSKKSMTILAL